MQKINDLRVEPIKGIVETHCHLSDAFFDDDREEVISRARAAGVIQMIEVGADIVNIPKAVELASKNPDIRAAIGIHPVSAAEWSSSIGDQIREIHQKHGSKIAAIGEIGLDYHWDSVERSEAKKIFIEQLDLADELKLPVVIHCRDAHDDLFDILESRNGVRCVIHCYAGDNAQANRAVKLGCYFGIGGAATYKKNQELRDVAASIPIDLLLIETDCPYVVPQKWRGKRNEPACTTAIVDLLADLRAMSPDEIARTTAENAIRLFG